MSSLEHEIVARLHVARAAALAAGEVLMRHFGQLRGFDEKGQIDLVTIADRESEALLIEQLRQAFPADALLGEEQDGTGGARTRRAEIEAAEFAWCIDPLDGTTSFVHCYPHFCVSIGLLSRGRPVLGVIFAPIARELFVGGVGIPATLNGKPIQVSSNTTLVRSLIATGFPYDRQNGFDEVLEIVRLTLLAVQDIRRSGAAAIDLCHVAAGRVDAYFERDLLPWDAAAGRAIVEAAGGKLSDYDGGPHQLFAPGTVASNGRIHDAVLALIQKGRAS